MKTNPHLNYAVSVSTLTTLVEAYIATSWSNRFNSKRQVQAFNEAVKEGVVFG